MGPLVYYAFFIVFTIPYGSKGQESLSQFPGGQLPINFLLLL